jgi:Uma2 family endonuclease
MAVQVQTAANVPTRRKFTTAEYYQMADAGVLRPDERLELIDGEIWTMTPIGVRHADCVTELNNLLVLRLGDVARVSVQNPVRLRDGTEPQPDFALLRRRPAHSPRRHPTPEEILLLIEVSDSTLRFDREEKVPRYARDGILETWVVDLEDDVLLIFQDPTTDGYRTSLVARRGEKVIPVSFLGRELAVDDILS